MIVIYSIKNCLFSIYFLSMLRSVWNNFFTEIKKDIFLSRFRLWNGQQFSKFWWSSNCHLLCIICIYAVFDYFFNKYNCNCFHLGHYKQNKFKFYLHAIQKSFSEFEDFFTKPLNLKLNWNRTSFLIDANCFYFCSNHLSTTNQLMIKDGNKYYVTNIK